MTIGEQKYTFILSIASITIINAFETPRWARGYQNRFVNMIYDQESS